MIKEQLITIMLACLFFPSAAQDTTYIKITKPGSGTQAEVLDSSSILFHTDGYRSLSGIWVKTKH